MKLLNLTLGALCATALFSTTLAASDHGDTPLLNAFACTATQLSNPSDPCHAANAKANQAKISDLFAFKRNNNLVLILNTNTGISTSATNYAFPTPMSIIVS